jgi:hypothetical protein
MNRVDREALRRALALVRSEPEYREQIAAKFKDEPWEAVATFAAYNCQCDNLGLKPWQDPPMYAEIRPDQPDAMELIGRGLSRYEPDPLAVLAEARNAAM